MRWFGRLPLRVSLPALFMLIIGIPTTLAAAAAIWQADAEVEREAQISLTQQMTLLQGIIDNLQRKGDAEGVRSAVAALGSDIDTEAAAIVDGEDRVETATDTAWVARLAVEAVPRFDPELARRTRATARGTVMVSADRRHVIGYYPIVMSGQLPDLSPSRLGVFYIQQDLLAPKASRRSQLGGQLVTIALSSLVALAAVWILTRSMVTKRVERLVSSVQRVATGDLSARADLAGNDELAAIARAVNRMVDTIEQNERMLAKDLADRIQAEQEREALRSQLLQSQKLESIGRLSGGVAHDFNNMLTVILGHTEMALSQLDESYEIHQDLREIRDAASRSADLTRQLLAFARRQTVAPQVLDLNDVIGGMTRMLRRLVGENLDIAWTPGATLWPVRIDPVQVDQLLTNLCLNARDAITGVGKVTIETQNVTFDDTYCVDHPEFVPGDYVMLAVSDNGRGMDPEQLQHLFEPFYTTKAMGRGTGLGLATVYGIVKQNSGYINVYSEVGKGTTFKVYLPQAEGAVVPVEGPIAEDLLLARGETVLLVEDEHAILMLGRSMLERLGYQVLTAGNPTDALHQAKSHPGRIDLLLTDVVMPEMNGRELAARLLPLVPGMKCLFMSGYTANVIAHHGVLDAGVHFMQKPFSLRDLAAKVRGAIDETE